MTSSFSTCVNTSYPNPTAPKRRFSWGQTTSSASRRRAFGTLRGPDWHGDDNPPGTTTPGPANGSRHRGTRREPVVDEYDGLPAHLATRTVLVDDPVERVGLRLRLLDRAIEGWNSPSPSSERR